jgi:proline iminopeptidase
MSERYPVVDPYEHGMLDVGDAQRIYWEVCGNPDGKPAVGLHGGPGAPFGPGVRGYFDPDRYRLVLFDQRGCGRSTPSAGEPRVDLSVNTTHHLIRDIERLREHLGVERWLVFGGSWGSTLGLAYAQEHPRRVSEMVLVSIVASTHREVRWITRDMGRIFPAEWARFRDAVPPAIRDGNLAAAYGRLLHDPDPAVRDRAAWEWCLWEDTHVATVADHEPYLTRQDPAWRLTFARLVSHYWSNAAWLADGALLAGAHRLAGIPGVLVHGRMDISGPADIAWHLAGAWPDAELTIIEGAGHGGGHAGTEQTVLAALDRFATPR